MADELSPWIRTFALCINKRSAFTMCTFPRSFQSSCYIWSFVWKRFLCVHTVCTWGPSAPDLACSVSEDAADPESIELVANEVLAMQMPTTPAHLQNLTEEIRLKVGELGHIESILQQSADDIQTAKTLLERARTARWSLTPHCLHRFWPGQQRSSGGKKSKKT